MKRPSARRRNRSTADFGDFAVTPRNGDGGAEVMDTIINTSQAGEEEAVGGVHEPQLMASTQEVVATTDVSQEDIGTLCPRIDKGKGRAVDEPEEKPFEFMELPTELRLEIYRACLTRPYKILLAKYIEPPVESVEADEDDVSDADFRNAFDDNNDEERRNTLAALQRMRVARGFSPRKTASLIAGRAARAGGHARALSRPAGPRRRQSHTLRFTAPALPVASSSAGNTNDLSGASGIMSTHPTAARQSLRPPKHTRLINRNTQRGDDPLVVNILRLNKNIYKEARSLLYSENVFDLSIDTAVPSLAALHQRSRRLIRHIELEIPSYTEIQDKFSEVVRLSLRYCSGLRKLVIHTPFCLPGGDGTATPNSNTQIWAQGFDILRWLPQQCDVELKGHKNVEIDEVVSNHLHLAKTLTPVGSSFFVIKFSFLSLVFFPSMRRAYLLTDGRSRMLTGS